MNCASGSLCLSALRRFSIFSKRRVSISKKTVYAGERNLPEVQEKVRLFNHAVAGIDPQRLIFLDESGAQTDMMRRYGRSRGKARVVDLTPQRNYKSMTIVSAIRLSGVIEKATQMFDGAMTSALFEEYVEMDLAPTLKKGDVVVMDNLSSHKGDRVRELIEKRGAAVAYLPPYHPDLNPIEKMWSKMKSILRKLRAQSVSALIKGVGKALRLVSRLDLAGWFECANYL